MWAVSCSNIWTVSLNLCSYLIIMYHITICRDIWLVVELPHFTASFLMFSNVFTVYRWPRKTTVSRKIWVSHNIRCKTNRPDVDYKTAALISQSSLTILLYLCFRGVTGVVSRDKLGVYQQTWCQDSPVLHEEPLRSYR